MIAKKHLLIAILLGVAIFVRSNTFYRSRPVFQDGQTVTLQGKVVDEPKLVSGRQRLRLQTADGIRVAIVTQVVPLYVYGDELVVSGVFTKTEFQGHIYWNMYSPNVQIVNKEHNFVTKAAQQLRYEAKNIVEGTLPPVASSLLLGIILGGKHSMPDEFLEKLQVVGVLHVIAASGMNVSFVAAFLLAFMAKFFKRSVALFTAMAGISFYVIVAGFEPSLVRAAIMSSFSLFASLLGRQSTGVWTLCLTGYVMLFFSPNLWEDVGFQLSFLATLGILTIKPLLDALALRVFSVWEKISWVNDDIMTSLAAQIATIPILFSVFGSYGLLSILVNALILWTVPLLMALGSLAIVTGLFFLPLGKVFLFLAYPFLWFFEWVVAFFGSTGWLLQIPEVPFAVWIGYYALIGAIVLVNKKRIKEQREEQFVREV